MDIVQNVDHAPAKSDSLGGGRIFKKIVGIDIASDCRHRRNLTEPGDDVRPTDVARVHDMRHARQMLFGFGPQQPVGIRDDSNLHCATIPLARSRLQRRSFAERRTLWEGTCQGVSSSRRLSEAPCLPLNYPLDQALL